MAVPRGPYSNMLQVSIKQQLSKAGSTGNGINSSRSGNKHARYRTLEEEKWKKKKRWKLEHRTLLPRHCIRFTPPSVTNSNNVCV